jgi:ABC-type lipoprotein export system ATPase subunit
MIELREVSKIFRTDIVETYALRDFDLSVNAGEFVAITGHSGCGKTTLLNVAGLLEESNIALVTSPIDTRSVSTLRVVPGRNAGSSRSEISCSLPMCSKP